MSTPSATAPLQVVPNEFPLRFKAHAFGAYCFNTVGCKVIYNHKYQIEDANDHVAPPSPPDSLKWWNTRELGVINFPPPAKVEWKTLDGTQHEATVDIGAIFADQKVLHHVPEEDIPEGWAHRIEPDIYLIVDDRTISVYMVTEIATKQLQEPGNRYSDYRVEFVRAWTHTY